MTTRPTLRQGDTGAAVKDLQKRLIAKGFSVGRWGADGIFGDGTDTAVRRYQSRVGLVVDGVVGPRTWAALTASGSTSASRFADRAYALVTGPGRPGYRLGAEVALGTAHPRLIDCSELVQWAVYQETHRDWVDGSFNQYPAGDACSISKGIGTKGALLFLTDNGKPSGIHHVAISMGNGHTAEARSRDLGCGSWSTSGRGWDYAATIPILHY